MSWVSVEGGTLASETCEGEDMLSYIFDTFNFFPELKGGQILPVSLPKLLLGFMHILQLFGSNLLP